MIWGYVKCGIGFVNNEFYIGCLIWNCFCYIKDLLIGKCVLCLNLELEWIIKDVLELCIVDDEFWYLVCVWQGEIVEKFVNVIEVVCKYYKKNCLNGICWLRFFLFGLVFCGCCGGFYLFCGVDWFVCLNYSSKGVCLNSCMILCEDLEVCVFFGLKDWMMVFEIVEEVMCVYVEEINWLNCECCFSGDVWKVELVKIEKQICGIIEVIKVGMFYESMKVEMDMLEVCKIELNSLLVDVLEDIFDILLSVLVIYVKKVFVLMKVFNCKEEWQEVVEILCGLIEKILLMLGLECGEIYVMLYGELSMIFEWMEC